VKKKNGEVQLITATLCEKKKEDDAKMIEKNRPEKPPGGGRGGELLDMGAHRFDDDFNAYSQHKQRRY